MESCTSSEEFGVDSDDYDVIVVGGGLTGLSAAHSILKKHVNLSLMIIEAKDSIGGRLGSSQNLEFFSHSFQDNFRRLTEKLKIDIEFGEQSSGERIVSKNGQVDRVSTIAALQVYYCMSSLNEASLSPDIDSSKPNEEHSILAEVSAAELINRMVMSSEAKLICSSVISLTCGLANLENVSALWLLTVLHGAGGLFQRLKHPLNCTSRYFIKGGVPTLIQRLRDQIILDGGTINCGETVTVIKYDEYRNFVRTSRKTYKCSYLIVAVPPPQFPKIGFEPALPETHTTQSLYTVTPLIYFEAKYKRDCWHPECSGSVIPLANSGRRLRVTHDVTHPPQNQTKTLAGFFSASGLNESQRVSELSQTLTNCFNLDEPNGRICYHEEAVDDGVMSVFGPCPADRHVNPMKMPYKRIFFAASEYARSWPGTADGAVEAGEHAACLVLHHARPQALSRSQILRYIPLRVRRTESNCELYVARTILLIANAMIFWSFLRRAYNF